MQLENKTLFITGANRGIGKALVTAVLKHKIKKVYAAARNIKELPNFGDSRVVPVMLDITDPNSVQKAVAQSQDVQILINNAGALAHASVLEGTMEELRKDMEVNYFGTLNITRTFVSVLQANGRGAIASVSSVLGLASMAQIGGYSASKAALFSAIQAMRAELKPKNIEVFGIFPGPIDTDMSRGIEMAKANVNATAENILKAIIAGTEDIFPDPMSEQIGKLWARDPKAVERQFAG